MAAQNSSRAGRATATKSTGARKVASPRKQAQAATPEQEPTPAPRRGRAPKAAAAAARAGTRTATPGAAARTSRAPRARTAAAGAAIEPDEILTAPASGRTTGSRGVQDPSPATAPTRNADGVIEEAHVSWRGRDWLVRLPTVEQMTIYRRLSTRFQALGEAQSKPDAEPMSMEEATSHFDRALKLITSVVVEPADIVWIEDEMLEGRLQLSDASDLMLKAMERFGELNPIEQNGTRAERRALKTGKARLGD